MARIILETDVTELVRGLTSGDLDHSMDGVFSSKFRDLISASFDYYGIRYCPRNCNRVADCLATHGVSMVSFGSAVSMS